MRRMERARRLMGAGGAVGLVVLAIGVGAVAPMTPSSAQVSVSVSSTTTTLPGATTTTLPAATTTTLPTPLPGAGDSAGWVVYTARGSTALVQHDPHDASCGSGGCFIPFEGLTLVRDLAFSPDGSRLVFSAKVDGGFNIYTSLVNGDNLMRLTSTGVSVVNDSPAWSPDGSKIVFQSTMHHRAGEIYTMGASSPGPARRLTKNVLPDDQPAWSKNNEIAFTRWRDGNTDIFVMNQNGQGQKALVATGLDESDPDWYPAGNMLAFSVNRRVDIIRRDGTKVASIKADAVGMWDARQPTFSPDGTRIAFVADSGDYFDHTAVHIVTSYLDGTGMRVIAGRAGSSPSTLADPDWQPNNLG